MSWFRKKSEKDCSKNYSTIQNLPINMRLMGLVKFKPSSKTFFLLNEHQLSTQIPQDDYMIEAISKFNLFGLNVYRAYLDSGELKSVIQVHVDNEEVKDVILFNKKFEIVVEDDYNTMNDFEKVIGFKDITTPDGYTYYRDWMNNEEDFVEPIEWDEDYLRNKDGNPNMIVIHNKSMLYSRELDTGERTDVEYLLMGFLRGLKKYRVEGWVGVVIGVEGLTIL